MVWGGGGGEGGMGRDYARARIRRNEMAVLPRRKFDWFLIYLFLAKDFDLEEMEEKNVFLYFMLFNIFEILSLHI